MTFHGVVRTMRLLPMLSILLACPILNGCQSAEDPRTPDAPTTAPRVTMTVRLGGASSLTVHQHVTFADPSYSLSLSPDPPEMSIGDEERFRPVISNLTVVAPGQAVQHVRRVDYDTWVSFVEPVREVTMEYRMSGVMVHQRPSVPGRYLVYATALSVGPVQGAERVITVQRALNLGCLTSDGRLEVCGHQTGDGWEVRLPPERAATSVLAQIQAT
jgi:hypothetical protein